MKLRTKHRCTAPMVLLMLLTPLLAGGCPEFQDQSITALSTAGREILNLALDFAFDQFRPNTSG